jgi:hypothetical protein
VATIAVCVAAEEEGDYELAWYPVAQIIVGGPLRDSGFMGRCMQRQDGAPGAPVAKAEVFSLYGAE